jgi:hypothetical protein
MSFGKFLFGLAFLFGLQWVCFSLFSPFFVSFLSGDSDEDILLWLRRNSFKQSSTGKDYGYAVLRFLSHVGFCCKKDIEAKFNTYVAHLFKEGSSYETVVKTFYGLKGFTKILGWKLWKDDAMPLLLRGYHRWRVSIKPPVQRRVPLTRADMKKLAKNVDRSSLFAVRNFVMCLLGFRAFLRFRIGCPIVAFYSFSKWFLSGVYYGLEN